MQIDFSVTLRYIELQEDELEFYLVNEIVPLRISAQFETDLGI